MSYLRPLTPVLIAFVLHPLVTNNTMACTCAESSSPPCAACWRADAVFVGSVTAIIPPSQKPTRDLPEATLRLSVEEAFRGAAVGTTLEIATLSGTSCDSHFDVGERCLVYAHRDLTSGRLHILPCDRTARLSAAYEDLSYIRGLSVGPSQSILGKLSEGKYDPLSNILIKVDGATKEYQTVTDDRGNYKIDIAQPGAYRVRLFVPFSAITINQPEFRVDRTEKQTILEYKLEISSGRCDYRETHLAKVDLTARAEISGKVVDTQGKGVADLTLYLYPATGQSLSGGDYELATTDTQGNYSFRTLKGGRYWLGVNLGKMPDVGAPYPTTFYPGVPSPEQATILSLSEGQRLIERDIQLPPKLVEREVTGEIVWTDGSPAARVSGRAPHVFSIRDPGDLSSLDPFRKDRTITRKVDEHGQFSFIGFEGYSYVIHVHAFDKQGRVVHAKHVKVKIEGEMKPIRLVLSLPGYGEKPEEMKKELEEPK